MVLLKTSEDLISAEKSSSLAQSAKDGDAMKKIWTELHFFLDDAEAKVQNISESLDGTISSLESSARLSIDEFREFLHEGEIWFSNLLKRVHSAENKADAFLERARVDLHLAKMDSKDRIDDLLQRIERFKSRLHTIKKRIGHESSAKIEKILENCNELKIILESTGE